MSAEDIEYMSDYKEFPTKESALDWLDNYLSLNERNNLIKALQQEPVLDKMRAEIEQVVEEESKFDKKWAQGLKYALKIIDKYMTESEDCNE